MQTDQHTGIIGLGAMGWHMAINLDRAGYLAGVWNRNADKAQQIAAKITASPVADLSALASACRVIIISVSRDADVLEIIHALLPDLLPDSVVIDTSTVSPRTAREAAAALAARQAHFLDAPVSGGVEGALAGTLAMMVGGDADILARVRPVLASLAQRIVHMGDHGAGQASKAINQLMAAGINQAVTEALAVADALKLDTDKVIDVISHGAASNWFLQHRGKTMLAGDYKPGFKMALHSKDLEICRELVADISPAKLPLLEMTLIHYQKLMLNGHGDEDISALFRLKKDYLSRSE